MGLSFVDVPFADIALAWSAYALGVASPGPSNFAVIETAMTHGRRAGVVFALGVAAGSAVWGVLVALGLSAVLLHYEPVVVAIRWAGGGYLLWIAARSARTAIAPAAPMAHADSGARASNANLLLRGAAMHLTNPKAMLVWLSIVAVALPASASRDVAWIVVVGCVPIGIATFVGYALVFSTARARSLHRRLQRPIAGVMAAVFGYAGFRLLASRAA